MKRNPTWWKTVPFPVLFQGLFYDLNVCDFIVLSVLRQIRSFRLGSGATHVCFSRCIFHLSEISGGFVVFFPNAVWDSLSSNLLSLTLLTSHTQIITLLPCHRHLEKHKGEDLNQNSCNEFPSCHHRGLCVRVFNVCKCVFVETTCKGLPRAASRGSSAVIAFPALSSQRRLFREITTTNKKAAVHSRPFCYFLCFLAGKTSKITSLFFGF